MYIKSTFNLILVAAIIFQGAAISLPAQSDCASGYWQNQVNCAGGTTVCASLCAVATLVTGGSGVVCYLSCAVQAYVCATVSVWIATACESAS